ncbi:60S ribosomal export protein NMD3, putative [Plasmodium sp. gorilla clade G2]|uniref:60S ribosomal export protein NMD3, putative n=1 Tax=Plasmodium sp. gorilla clade G2 TaxID=880535 RepID=UPI000D20624B|nr:60S ribosomal export protein NMD3, putative [Plasmodium sp. gorilla clade G2]SOV13242.1 60S ribosomal export protein NMD3, putative [Plasmodium sp. gorilla clade G2]
MNGKKDDELIIEGANNDKMKSPEKCLIPCIKEKFNETNLKMKIVKKVTFIDEHEDHIKNKKELECESNSNCKKEDVNDIKKKENDLDDKESILEQLNGNNTSNEKNGYLTYERKNCDVNFKYDDTNNINMYQQNIENDIYLNKNNYYHYNKYMNLDYKDNISDEKVIYEKYDKREYSENHIHPFNIMNSCSSLNNQEQNYSTNENNNIIDNINNNLNISYSNHINGNNDIINTNKEINENMDEDKDEEKIKGILKNKLPDFNKSYNDSLNNYLSSSFVDILNTLKDVKNDNSDTSQINSNSSYINNPENYNPNNNDDNNLRYISCILCGDSIKANTSKMCHNCILQNIESNSININKDTYLIYYCRECKRYLHNRWVYCELESKELLALCLKKVNKLKKLKILDAKFLYTEPHSKRLKVHVSVQEELINNFISEMEIIIHYVIKYTQCDDCKKKYTPYTYNTCVSVRQKVEHKKTLLFLESLLLKCNMNENIINIVSNPDGLDFHFLSRTDALKFCDFILSKTMSKCKNSKHLINHDANNNTYNYLYTFSIDICPICKDDLIFFPKGLATKYGIKNVFYLCIHVSIFIILINPFSSANHVYISPERYNKNPFLPLLSKADAKVFLILNIEYINDDTNTNNHKNNINPAISNNDNANLNGHINNSKKKNKKRKNKRRKGINTKDDDSDSIEEDNHSISNEMNNNHYNCSTNKNNLKRKKKDSNNLEDINKNSFVFSSSDNEEEENLHKPNHFDKNSDIYTDAKSARSSSRKVKLDKLVYAFVELYDESNGTTILTKTCNAKHLRPGDYVNAYDLRKHSFDNEINLFLEKNDNYNIIIIDKVKTKEKEKIEQYLQVQNNNIETMKRGNEQDIFNRILLNNCKALENMAITSM